MRISAKQRKRVKKRSFNALLFFAAVGLALFVWADFSMRPAVERILEYETQVFASRLINEAILSQADEGDDYGELVRVTRNQDGEATSLEADMAAVNRYKYNVTTSVLSELEKRENQEILLPIGTVIGNQFTSGRGPNVAIKVIPAGYVQTDVFNSFTAAGINQTLHRIMMRVNVSMTAVLPGYSVNTETETSFCIAETVIVGEIPEGYAAIDGTKFLENRE